MWCIVWGLGLKMTTPGPKLCMLFIGICDNNCTFLCQKLQPHAFFKANSHVILWVISSHLSLRIQSLVHMLIGASCFILSLEF